MFVKLTDLNSPLQETTRQATGLLNPEAQDQVALLKVLQQITPESCPKSYNFHMHTVKSDGRLQPDELIDQAIQIGLQGLAITDHHTVEGYQIAQAHLNQWKASHPENQALAPVLWTGLEISAGLLGIEVHVLAYGFDPEAPSLQPYLQRETVYGELYAAQQVIAAIHQAQGLAVLAHPARYKVSASALIPEATDLGIDGVETYYNYRHTNPWNPTPEITDEVRTLADHFNLLNTCGTDTHGLNLLLRL
ncbi:MAG: PHP domain-containing protein [Oscillatoriales cyanobacterium RM1_1_9]|nr:PHP domain-containing protein [Oscillatoriales cyanobacterium SM2_3_0]NJO47388.1 PHP domain-containing protein [Oscillatoriales cyanobacterium RM2_1_1]NJO71353.1 PHP domain-containing protein [Oscillatoriales cyanobacterium RM1_1_9]